MRRHHLLNSLFILIFLLSPVLSACGRRTPASNVTSAETPPAASNAAPALQRSAPLPPLLVRTVPNVGEEQSPAAPVILTFDQPMDPSSTAQAFSIEPQVSGEVTVKGNQVVFTPSEELNRSTEYQVQLDDSASSANGMHLLEPVSFRLRTVGFLEVTGTQPEDGTDDVPIDSVITVSFNRPVVPLTGMREQAGLPQPLTFTPPLEGHGEWLNTSVYQFVASDGLAASTSYRVVVQEGLEDTTGATLDTSYEFTFHTTDPVVVSWNPAEPTQVGIDSPITVTFSTPMDPITTEAAFTMVRRGQGGEATDVAGTFKWSSDATEMGFHPDEDFDFGASYVAAVEDSAQPANGEGQLRRPDSLTFQTVPLPAVIGSDPANGDTSADPYAGVNLRFASPMDPSTFITGSVTIIPEPADVFTSYNDWEDSLYIGFDKLPATPYVITLSGDVADPYGNELGEDYVLRFTTRDYDPLVQLNTPGQVGTYSAYTNTQAIVTHRNVAEVAFDLYSVTIPDFIALTAQDYWQAWDRYSPREADKISEWIVQTDAPQNETSLLRSDLVTEEGEQLNPGLYYLVVSGDSTTRAPVDSYRQLLARTDLNVTLKTSEDEALAWVTDLKSGQPVADVSVRFTDNAAIDLQARTDADGVATVSFAQSRQPWEPLLVLAEGRGGEFGVASSNWQNGISAWDFDLQGGGMTDPYVSYVYTDRPIYRPGQTVYWKAIIRQDDDAIYSLPAPGQPVTVTIQDDRGNELLNEVKTLSALGTADGSLALDLDASLGYYNISVQLTDEARYGTAFQVAEYRRPEYEISAQTDRPEYVQGDRIRVTVQANYFFGGPVRDGKVEWTLLGNDYHFEYQGEGNYSFTDWEWWDMDRYGFAEPLSQGEGVTDSQGQFTFTVLANIGDLPQSQRFMFDISITDVNNQVVTTQASAIVHKGNFYIGLQPERYVATVDKPTALEVITVDPQSEPVPDTRVTAVVNKVEWFSVREEAEDGRFYWTTQAEKTPVYTQTLTTDDEGRALLEWTPEEGGEYKVEATGRDRASHLIRSGAFLWVSGQEYVTWRQENNDRIQMVADKDEYEVGDVAEVLVASPYQGRVTALLTIERNHILSHELIELRGNSQLLRIPIESEHAPNIFVSVMLVKGIDESSPSPSFRMGLVQLNVSVVDKELDVVVTPDRWQVGPRESVTWEVSVLDAKRRPVPDAEVSLALVDKATLSLASDNSGALIDRFYSQRSLGVQTASTLVMNVDRLVAQLSEGGKGGGGGGMDMGGLAVRREFPDIAYWNASVTTDNSGRAEVEIDLPDNLTTWTMDARAVTGDTLVGQSKTDLIATKDLLVRPVLPRFFVEGDQADIAGIIHNNTREDLAVSLAIQATGLDLQAEAESRVTVPAQGTYEAVWPVEVRPADRSGTPLDEVTVLIRAESAALSDAVEMTLPVYHYATPDIIGTAGQVPADDSRLELIRLPEDIDPDRGGVDIRLEPSLAAGMRGGLTYLQHYPYECVEQTLSRFLPNVVTYQAMQSLGVQRPDLDTALPQEVSVGLQRLYSNQHIDGGWGWWQRDESNVFVTAYVVFGLAKASEAGFTVETDVLRRAVGYLERNLEAPRILEPFALNQQAFALYALAEAGEMEPNRAGALYEERERLSLYGKGYLALALHLIDDDASENRIRTLLTDINGKAVTSATGAHWEEEWTDYRNMNTDIRTTAIIVDVLARLEPGSSIAPNAVRWLMSARKAEHWPTTQENAWVIMALTDWMVATGELEGNYAWQVLLNNQRFDSGTVTPDTVEEVVELRVGIGQLLLDQTNALLLERSAAGEQADQGQLYYTAHLKTYVPVEKVQPTNRGVSVSREYRLAECPESTPAGAQERQQSECPTITRAQVGDIIEVTLNVVVPDTLHYLVVEDPLPAGTEAVDSSLRTTSIMAEGPQMEMVGPEDEVVTDRPWWHGWMWAPDHTDLRDEKVALFSTTLQPGTYQYRYQIRASLPGRFLTLPPMAYEMYFPEVWGSGAGSVFVVTE